MCLQITRSIMACTGYGSCMNCGHEWQTSDWGKVWEPCPQCGTRYPRLPAKAQTQFEKDLAALFEKLFESKFRHWRARPG